MSVNLQQVSKLWKHMYSIVYRLCEIKSAGCSKFMEQLPKILAIAKSITASPLLDILLHLDYKWHIKKKHWCVVAFSVGTGTAL